MNDTSGIKHARWILMVFGILLALLIGELAARAWLAWLADDEDIGHYALYADIPAEQLLYSPHPYLTYYPTPGYHRGRHDHNSLGYRGPEVAIPKPEDVFRIVCLGGSTTYTNHVRDNSQTYPAVLQRILREEYGRGFVEVVNAGASGYNSWESLINLALRVVDLEPDLVIIYHGTNDVHSRLVRDYRGDGTGFRMTWTNPPVRPWERSVLMRIVARKIGIDRQVGLSSLTTRFRIGALGEDEGHARLDASPPRYFARNLRSMVALARAHDAEVLLATWAHNPGFDDYASTDHYRRGFRENNEVVNAVGAATGTPVFDFAAVMPQDLSYWSDGRHVTAAGATVKAELFAGFLVEHGLVPAELDPR